MESVELPGRITVVGLGYVGLPLALAFSKQVRVTGYDISEQRVAALRNGIDQNGEVLPEELRQSDVEFTTDPACLCDAEFIIVTVPTPVDDQFAPDLGPLMGASETIGRQLSLRSRQGPPPVIVFESTTFPGCTEDVCGAAIERLSGLRCGEEFKLGYSPERTNFGDREHNLATVVKVVSGQDEQTAQKIEAVYRLVAESGTHRAPDIRTAEAAKVIENIQRDLNIAFVNELAVIFDRLGLSTSDVLAAAATKWNFMPFKPGLVGGHCIPVDPYYLMHRSLQAGYEPHVITAGRRVNESMAHFIGDKLLELMALRDQEAAGYKILVLGLAFKPNIADARNSKIADLVRYLVSRGATVEVHDPRVGMPAFLDYAIEPAPDPFGSPGKYHAVVLATPHSEFLSHSASEFRELLDGPSVLVDVTGTLDRPELERLGATYWRP